MIFSLTDGEQLLCKEILNMLDIVEYGMDPLAYMDYKIIELLYCYIFYYNDNPESEPCSCYVEELFRKGPRSHEV
jgi:hypothetical protein